MNFFIIDDDEVVRSMLCDIIEDYDLGNVVGELDNGSTIDSTELNMKNVNILLIDLLMPNKDGLTIVKDLKDTFSGKFIMISQLEDKNTIGKAYSIGIQYYITKPINRLEVVGIIHKVIEQIKLEKSIDKIQDALDFLKLNDMHKNKVSNKNILTSSEFLLNELGIPGESGSKDLLSIMKYLYDNENKFSDYDNFPQLKDLFIDIAKEKLGENTPSYNLTKEVKASEQRIRRTIMQALNHVASIGLTDYSNPKFEEYSSEFFEFEEVRKKMIELEKGPEFLKSPVHINTKRFIKIFYSKAKKIL
ncbi:two-component system response regulator YcbB [Clostridium algifaecis]|uniref:Stage 0 sporulation protein A homolog n=1 Tax=Clostridium algifaecis TaxID=1472040 RepID=A0ABS4KP88_9CLOT|nr:response regulator [Clostridium algifaecis]MBP2031860.1 two-component system response regulator YcbB [Clostridium algifaecis]